MRFLVLSMCVSYQLVCSILSSWKAQLSPQLSSVFPTSLSRALRYHLSLPLRATSTIPSATVLWWAACLWGFVYTARQTTRDGTGLGVKGGSPLTQAGNVQI